MLEFFRKYQRYFLVIITVVMISSFAFFGVYSTFGGAPEREDRTIGQIVNGSKLMLSEVQNLSRLIATDREDLRGPRGSFPNLCNDGVIRNDFFKSQLADLLVSHYFQELKSDLAERLDKAKRFRPYSHPQAPALSAKAIWGYAAPTLIADIEALQKEVEVTPSIFTQLARLCEIQRQVPPETVRRFLLYQQQQYGVPMDPRLAYDDMALFGFHSALDWFGHNFIDLVAQFILNAAAVAEEKGYRVSLEEAKGDLICHFQESVQKMGLSKQEDLNFHQHLKLLGFDERSAAESWQKVLLFRKYFHDVGESAFVDRLPYKDFAGYAKECAVVQKYNWPISLKTAQDLAEFQFYLKAVSAKGKTAIPTAILPVDELEKKFPELVSTTYGAKVAEVTKLEVSLRAPLKEVWEWELSEKNWPTLKKEFSLQNANSREERFQVLEKLEPKVRASVDAFARNALVDLNPAWVDEALALAPVVEKTWEVAGKAEPILKKNGVFYKVEDLRKVKEKRILSFHEAKGALAKLVEKVEGECSKEKNPFFTASKEALAALQKNPKDTRWVQLGEDPVLDQFKLECKTEEVLRTSKEDWMKEQAFMMLQDLWSPIHVADGGEITFFYLAEKKRSPAPILEQLCLGKETLAADAKKYVAERLLQTVKNKKAIVIPTQNEGE
jgi:hypothetical protein